VSVHPGRGSVIAPMMIDGRNKNTGNFGFLRFLRVLSAIDLVKV
jgi:hypothetical protein